MNSGARLKKFIKHRKNFRTFRRKLTLEIITAFYKLYGFSIASYQLGRSTFKKTIPDFATGGIVGDPQSRLAMIGPDHDTPEYIISSELFEAKRITIPDNVIMFGVNDKLKSISDDCK